MQKEICIACFFKLLLFIVIIQIWQWKRIPAFGSKRIMTSQNQSESSPATSLQSSISVMSFKIFPSSLLSIWKNFNQFQLLYDNSFILSHRNWVFTSTDDVDEQNLLFISFVCKIPIYAKLCLVRLFLPLAIRRNWESYALIGVCLSAHREGGTPSLWSQILSWGRRWAQEDFLVNMTFHFRLSSFLNPFSLTKHLNS